jgi:NAD-dependent DNA ligase
MVGLVRGVIADGSVSSDEAEQLAKWTRENPDVALSYPANVLARRLERIFHDGRVDGRERHRLKALLAQLAENPAGLSGGFRLATDLPVSRPTPEVVFEGQTFVFAGEMDYGPTHACEREVNDRGGTCERLVNRRTDYVVIGNLAAEDWCQLAFGSLIDEVVQYRARGVPIAVVSEADWVAALD